MNANSLTYELDLASSTLIHIVTKYEEESLQC